MGSTGTWEAIETTTCLCCRPATALEVVADHMEYLMIPRELEGMIELSPPATAEARAEEE